MPNEEMTNPRKMKRDRLTNRGSLKNQAMSGAAANNTM